MARGPLLPAFRASLLFHGGDANLYRYALGDPINFVDRAGLSSTPAKPHCPSDIAWHDYMDWVINNPSLDFAVGLADGVSLNIGPVLRDSIDYIGNDGKDPWGEGSLSSQVDQDSGAYLAGDLLGGIFGLVGGAGVAKMGSNTFKAGSKTLAKGKELGMSPKGLRGLKVRAHRNAHKVQARTKGSNSAAGKAVDAHTVGSDVQNLYNNY